MSQTLEDLSVALGTANLLRNIMRGVLTRSVNAIRGDPEPLHEHSWHDLPELIDQLKVDLREALADKENAAATITRLQGEAKVMLILLAKALDVLYTIDPDCATEQESLEELTDAIEAVLKARPIANKSAVDLLLEALAILLGDWSHLTGVKVCAAGARGAGDGNCSKHPAAPHGFDRNGSHAAGRYVCECENWEPGEAS